MHYGSLPALNGQVKRQHADPSRSFANRGRARRPRTFSSSLARNFSGFGTRAHFGLDVCLGIRVRYAY
jgi:hypothetical protein